MTDPMEKLPVKWGEMDCRVFGNPGHRTKETPSKLTGWQEFVALCRCIRSLIGWF